MHSAHGEVETNLTLIFPKGSVCGKDRLLIHGGAVHLFSRSSGGFLRRSSHASLLLVSARSRRVHPDRAVGGDRDHRDPDRPAAARRAEGPRGRRPHELHEQPQADRPRVPQPPRRPRHLPARGLGPPRMRTTGRARAATGRRLERPEQRLLPVGGVQLGGPDPAVRGGRQPLQEHQLQRPGLRPERPGGHRLGHARERPRPRPADHPGRAAGRRPAQPEHPGREQHAEAVRLPVGDPRPARGRRTR